MTRVKRGTTSLKSRRNILKQTKGFRWGRKSKERAAKEALAHAYTHAFHDRRKKKNVMRRLWQVKINAGVRPLGITYSKFIDKLKKADVLIDRKILAELAQKEPEVLSQIVERTMKSKDKEAEAVPALNGIKK